MKHIITTTLGNFEVHMSYSPSADDMTLNKLTQVINNFSIQPMLLVANQHPELDTIKDNEKIANLAIKLLNEAKVEKALYETTRAGNGAGVPINLSLKERKIELRNL